MQVNMFINVCLCSKPVGSHQANQFNPEHPDEQINAGSDRQMNPSPIKQTHKSITNQPKKYKSILDQICFVLVMCYV